MASLTDIDAHVVITAVKPVIGADWLQWFRIHLPVGPAVGGAVKDASREEIITIIEVDRKKVCTAVQRDGNWVIGANVGVVSIAGVVYPRTDQNPIAEDNLGELPIIDSLMQSGHIVKI